MKADDECMVPGCDRKARMADVEYKRNNPNDYRGQFIRCNEHDDEHYERGRDKREAEPPKPPCHVCSRPAYLSCFFCKKLICYAHRRMPIKNNDNKVEYSKVAACTQCSIEYDQIRNKDWYIRVTGDSEFEYIPKYPSREKSQQ